MPTAPSNSLAAGPEHRVLRATYHTRFGSPTALRRIPECIKHPGLALASFLLAWLLRFALLRRTVLASRHVRSCLEARCESGARHHIDVRELPFRGRHAPSGISRVHRRFGLRGHRL